MRADRVIQLVAAILLAGCFVAAGALMPSINASASDAQLKYTDEAAEGAPLPVVIAQSVGVLRGVMVNYLWIRADKLKEDGKYFEAYHIAKWITDLQPRFASVWQFQAWNMAYNISVATHTREERWNWVNAGVRLLREKGIRYNPNDMGLYKELAWTFFHKIGGATDDANMYYKQQMAHEWQGILGPPAYEEDERLEAIEIVAGAPGRLDAILDEYPAATSLVAELDAIGFKLDVNLLHAIERLRAAEFSFLGEQLNLAEELRNFDRLDRMTPEQREQVEPYMLLRRLRDEPRYAEVWPALLAHTRKRVLLDNYNMDPEYMRLFMEQFGPLDWRTPQAHSVYWAAIGVERGLGRYQQESFDQINTDRLLFHSLQDLRRKGRIFYDYLTQEISFGPDLRFTDYYLQAADIVIKRNPFGERGGGSETYKDGMRNFLIDAVREYYLFGEIAKAEELYRRLRTEFAQEDKPDRFMRPLPEFIMVEMRDRYSSPDVARPAIMSLIGQAYRYGLAREDREAYSESIAMARQLYDYIEEFYADYRGQIETNERRIRLSPWPEMLRNAFIMVMTDEAVSLEERVALYNSGPVERLRLETYDDLLPQLQNSVVRRLGSVESFDRFFPPPPGIEEYRARRQATPDEEKNLQIERK
ncbi:MAG: hypothetical protein ACF8PN_12240 [Phycisphaerales bacterium]